jgi:hypothetical protein
MHGQSMKFLLRGYQGIDIYFAALNEDPNLAGRF